jgi:hypothetical protein
VHYKGEFTTPGGITRHVDTFIPCDPVDVNGSTKQTRLLVANPVPNAAAATLMRIKVTTSFVARFRKSVELRGQF